MRRNTFRTLAYAVVAALVCSPAARLGDAQTLTTCETRPNLKLRSDNFGPFDMGGAKYEVLLVSALLTTPSSTGATLQEVSPDQTLVHICVQNGNKDTVWERSFDWNAASATRTLGTAYEVQGQTGEGIVLETGKISAKHIPAGKFTILAQRNGHLEVLAPEVKFYGMVEHIPDAGLDRRRLVTGDVIRCQFWTGHYYMVRGIRVDFGGGTVVPLCSHNCTFSVMYQATPLKGDATVQLFNQPLGKSRRVAVRRQSTIEFLDAYVEDIATIDCARRRREGRPWLHVRIDENDGWMSEPRDMEKLGLPHIERTE